MRIYKFQKMYLPALSIVTVVLLLLILISISTYRNLDRDKRKAMWSLHRQGVGLIHSIEAFARVGFATSPLKDSMDEFIREIGKNEDIAYIYIVDSEGGIIHHSDPAKKGNITSREVLFPLQDGVSSQVRQFSKVLRVYELTKAFSPFLSDQSPQYSSKHTTFEGGQSRPYLNHVIVLGLKMIKFQEAQRADLYHAVIMAAILVALGSGALFFIFVIQNYYLVDKTLKETQDYTRQVVANMANGLLSINTAGEVVSYNILALRLLEMDEKDVLGMDLRKVIDFKTSGISETLTQHGSILEREILYQPKSGETIPLSLSVTPILSEDRPISGAVIVLRDLREIKQLQEKVRRSEKLAAIGELAAGVAHEIRNPLSSIKGFAQFLRHTLRDRPEEQEYTSVMVREIDRINRVVKDLLIYARPLTAKREQVNIKGLVDHTVLLVNADAQAQHVTILQDLSGTLNSIFIDENQMIHALLNLLLNSLEAVSEGGRIEIGARLNDTGEQLHLWVEDDGRGIPREHQEKIIDPFFTTRDKGTGLGLAIVHKIVETHEGEIHIMSPPQGKDKGTKVSLHIPLYSSHMEREAQ
ncbi:MAG: ATP-binding protein [Thermodesulfobacteriota bacterium]|nr:ATP-binding protein [Thermodesulfobacteriota bacterium]